MTYAATLKALRAQLEEQATGRAPKEESSFIPTRGQPEQPPQESTEDILSRSREWLSAIREASAQAQKNVPEISGGLAEGLAQGLAGSSRPKRRPPRNEEEMVERREVNREAFISRRENSPSTYAPGNYTTFLDAIDQTESGGSYDTLFGHSQRDGKAFSGTRVSEMTIGELKDFANGAYGEWSKNQLGYKATPMGRYQFVGTTMAAVAKQMGLSDDTVFSKDVQDAMFDFQLGKTLKRADTMPGKISALRNEWEGFKHIPEHNLIKLIQEYEAS